MAVRKLLSVAIPLAAAVAVFAPSIAAEAAVTGDYSGSGVYLRTGPHTGSTAVGQGFHGQGATIFCYAIGDYVNGDRIWVYNRDNVTGITGYSSDYYMQWSGQLSQC
jgi:uncharacterized protein YraI